MEKNVTDYDNEITTISLSLLLELMMVLKGYSNDMVLVGGWVPFFLLKKHNTDPSFQHVGSVDIDLVLDPELITQGRYDSIVEILIKNGYSPRKDRLGNIIEFSFEKTIQDRTIHVDFLSTIYPDRPERRHRIVQPDLQARTLKGARIVLTHFYLDKIDGTLPNKAEVEVECKIANLVGSLVTKAIAIGDRTDPKDYYDIYSLISYYKNGTSSCAEEITPYLQNKDIKEAMAEIKKNFAKETSLGPTLVGSFIYPNDPDAQRRVMTDSFMRINDFLQKLGLKSEKAE